MKRLFRTATIMVAGTAVMLAAGTAAAQYSPNDVPGAPGQENVYTREITVRPDTKYLNVHGDEVIKFVDSASGRSFVWNFNTLADRISMSRIAPPGMFSGSNIVIYRAPAWREIGQPRD